MSKEGLDAIKQNTELVSKVNVAKSIFVDSMLDTGVITEEQALVMHSCFIHLVNDCCYSSRFWALYSKAIGTPAKTGQEAYFAVSRPVLLDESIEDIINVLNDQITPEKKTHKTSKSGNIIKPHIWDNKPDEPA